jgi:hypothetical protein
MTWIILLTIVGLIATAVTAGYTVALGVTILILVAVLAWAAPGYFWVQVPELEVAVVGNQGQRRFFRFLPPGCHWLRPFEQVTATISLNGLTAGGQSRGIQTSGGLPLTITWSVSYTLEPLRVQHGKQAKAAHLLPDKSAAAVGKHMGNILQHVMGELSIEMLCQPGRHQQLERQVRQQLAARLDDLGFAFSRVMLGPIEMPAKVQAALATAHERRLQTELEAAALTRLHEAIRQFSDKDMARLVELERIHALGQHGVALTYDRPVSSPQWRVVNGGYTVISEQ